MIFCELRLTNPYFILFICFITTSINDYFVIL